MLVHTVLSMRSIQTYNSQFCEGFPVGIGTTVVSLGCGLYECNRHTIIETLITCTRVKRTHTYKHALIGIVQANKKQRMATSSTPAQKVNSIDQESKKSISQLVNVHV